MVFTCNQCQFLATSKYILKTHNQTVHEGVVFTCKQCQFSARSERTLKLHVQNIHEGIVYPCEFCPKSYVENKKRKRHIREVHQESFLTCSQCNFTGISRSLKCHIQSVHDKKTYPCDQCNLSLKTKSGVGRHKKNIHKGEAFLWRNGVLVKESDFPFRSQNGVNKHFSFSSRYVGK